MNGGGGLYRKEVDDLSECEMQRRVESMEEEQTWAEEKRREELS